MRRSIALGLLSTALAAAPARATFHLWAISEVYTSADQSVQFIEFTTADGFQQFLTGHQLQSVAGGEVQETYTFPTNLPVGSGETTAGRSFLFATPGFQAVAGIAPDYEWSGVNPFIPLPPVGDSGVLILGGLGLGIANLPTDGALALLGDGVTTAVPTPTNFAGETGEIVPEIDAPVLAVVALASLRTARVRRRRGAWRTR